MAVDAQRVLRLNFAAPTNTGGSGALAAHVGQWDAVLCCSVGAASHTALSLPLRLIPPAPASSSHHLIHGRRHAQWRRHTSHRQHHQRQPGKEGCSACTFVQPDSARTSRLVPCPRPSSLLLPPPHHLPPPDRRSSLSRGSPTRPANAMYSACPHGMPWDSRLPAHPSPTPLPDRRPPCQQRPPSSPPARTLPAMTSSSSYGHPPTTAARVRASRGLAGVPVWSLRSAMCGGGQCRLAAPASARCLGAAAC